MAVGTISQELYLTGLPPNSTFTVTRFEIEKKQDWYAYLHGRGYSPAPYEVKPRQNESGGLVVYSKLSSTTVFVKGTGNSGTMHFTINCIIDGKEVSKNGYFKFTATDWGSVKRPAYFITMFGFDGEPIRELMGETPTFVQPDPLYMNISLKNNQLYLIASLENNLSTTIISNVLDGILTVHTKALSWAVGLIF